MAKRKFFTWYDTLEPKEGTIHEKETKTNLDSEEDTNINRLIEKYGVEALALKTKPDEELYIDTTLYEGMTLNDIIQEKQRIKEYYEQLPSKVRKTFGDNYDNFFEKLRKGDLDEFINNGILSEDTKNAILETIQNKEKDYVAQLTEEYKIQEKAKILAQKEINGGTEENEN